MAKESKSITEHCEIGVPKTLSLSTPQQNRHISIELAKQACYNLDIVCRDLDHALYDNDDFHNAVKQLAISNPKAKIRLLIQNSNKAVKQGHRLVDLARRLSSFIGIRLQGKDFKEFNEAWFIVDNKAWIRRRVAGKYAADVDYCAARQLKEIAKTFDSMWNQANNDPNLRRLSM